MVKHWHWQTKLESGNCRDTRCYGELVWKYILNKTL